MPTNVLSGILFHLPVPVKDCGIPDPVIHAELTVTTTTFLSTVSYICDPGYSMSSQNAPLQITCLSDATWEKKIFSCDGKNRKSSHVIV